MPKRYMSLCDTGERYHAIVDGATYAACGAFPTTVFNDEFVPNSEFNCGVCDAAIERQDRVNG